MDHGKTLLQIDDFNLGLTSVRLLALILLVMIMNNNSQETK